MGKAAKRQGPVTWKISGQENLHILENWSGKTC